MYSIASQLVNQAIMSDSRTFRALLDFGNFTISGADVGRITTEHTISDDVRARTGRSLPYAPDGASGNR